MKLGWFKTKNGGLKTSTERKNQGWMHRFNDEVLCCFVGDVDGDNMNEVVAGGRDNTLRVLNGKNGKQKWIHKFDGPVWCCFVGDVDGDNMNEVVAGGYDNTLRVLNGKNGKQKWIHRFNSRVRCCFVGDVDGDGTNEVVVGSWYILRVLDGVTGEQKWMHKFDGHVWCCFVGDVDGDGMNEVVVGSGDDTLRVLEGTEGEQKWMYKFDKAVKCCFAGDVDDNGLKEVVAGSEDGVLKVLIPPRILKRNDILSGILNFLEEKGIITVSDVLSMEFNPPPTRDEIITYFKVLASKGMLLEKDKLVDPKWIEARLEDFPTLDYSKLALVLGVSEEIVVNALSKRKFERVRSEAGRLEVEILKCLSVLKIGKAEDLLEKLFELKSYAEKMSLQELESELEELAKRLIVKINFHKAVKRVFDYVLKHGSINEKEMSTKLEINPERAKEITEWLKEHVPAKCSKETARNLLNHFGGRRPNLPEAVLILGLSVEEAKAALNWLKEEGLIEGYDLLRIAQRITPPATAPSFAFESGLTPPGYRVEKLIGRGGFSRVYLCVHNENSRVAVKVPDISVFEADTSELIEMFMREAQIWSKLRHPNIVEVYDYAVEPIPYIAMEYLSGGSLRSRIGELRVSEAVKIFLQIAQAVSWAHHFGVVHRDLKPENILFTDSGIPKVSDWGLAKIMIRASTTSGEFTGTLLYSAPEQVARSFGGVDWRTDIYQLGVVLYEMLTGKLPFPTNDPGMLINSIINETPQNPCLINPEIPRELGRTILRSLAKKKEDRFSSVDLMREAIEKALEQ